MPRSSSYFVAAVAFAIAVAGWSLAQARPKGDTEADRVQMEAWWVSLEKGEEEATGALLRMSARPKETVAFLERRVKPLKIEAEHVRALLDWLASDKDETWKPAFEELEYFDPRLAIDLVDLMNDIKDKPARQRLVAALSGRDPVPMMALEEISIRPVGEGFNFFAKNFGSWWAEPKVANLNIGYANPKKKWTRAVRAIVLLEFIGSPEATALLKEMATGHPDAQPTKAAQAALDRLKVK